MTEGAVTRRQVLGAGLVGGMGVALAGCFGDTASKVLRIGPAGSDLGAVEHLVFLIQENRSFDNYFGTYPGVRGFDDHPAKDLGVFSQAFPANTDNPPVGRLLPFHLDTLNSDAECTYDLSHDWVAQHMCWNNGRMDSFVTTHTSNQFEGPGNGVLTMGYYERQDLPFYYALADAFTICDGYHCSVFGPTHPNRLFSLSATNDPGGHAGGPVIITSSNPDAQFSVSWATMPEVLEDAGISWKMYNPPGPEYLPTAPDAILVSNNIALYFKQYSSPSSLLYKKAFLPLFPNDFRADVARGTLPSVSWLYSATLPQDQSEHPPSPPPPGERFVHQVVDILSSNPSVWSRTALFLTYDENDGFFDHVAPPTPPPGTPGEYLTVDPLPSDAGGIAGPTGLGFRVPCLVISPFSRGGRVVHETFDHTSMLRLVEARFGAKVPNLSAWRRSVTGDMTRTLDPFHRDTSVPELPATPANDPLVAKECQPAQLIEINVPSPPYPVPNPQVVPTQERRHHEAATRA